MLTYKGKEKLPSKVYVYYRLDPEKEWEFCLDFSLPETAEIYIRYTIQEAKESFPEETENLQMGYTYETIPELLPADTKLSGMRNL